MFSYFVLTANKNVFFVGEAKGIPTFISRGVYYLCPTGLLRLLQLPKCFTRLCVFQFFAWTSLMSYNLFFTDFVGEAVFDGDPTLEAGPLKNELYDEGIVLLFIDIKT